MLRCYIWSTKWANGRRCVMVFHCIQIGYFCNLSWRCDWQDINSVSHTGEILNRLLYTVNIYFAYGSGGKVLWSVASVYLSVCVCVSVCPTGYRRKHACNLYQIFLCMLPMAVAQSYSGRVTKSQGEGQFWGFSSALTMHFNALAANNVMQQQNGPYCCCQWVMGVHNAGEVWSTIALFVTW